MVQWSHHAKVVKIAKAQRAGSKIFLGTKCTTLRDVTELSSSVSQYL